MTNPWIHKLEESLYDDLSADERKDLIVAMESDKDLRDKVLSDLRFESVLKETLRTEESSTYRNELQEKWSVDKVKSQMLHNGMTPISIDKNEKAKLSGSNFTFLVIGLLGLGVVFSFWFSSNHEKSEKVVETTRESIHVQGKDMNVLRDGRIEKVSISELQDGDTLGTGNEGWANFTLEQGVFIELGKNAEVQYLNEKEVKELRLIKGNVFATVAAIKSKKRNFKLSTQNLMMKGSGYKIKLNQMDGVSTLDALEGRIEITQLKTNKLIKVRVGEQLQLFENGKFIIENDSLDPLDKDLVGWWSMDDGQGMTIDDFSGRGQSGSLAQHVKISEGRRGQALMISEINRNNLQIPFSPELNIHPEHGITLMAWIKTTRTLTATILDNRHGVELQNKYSGYQLVLVNGSLSFQMGDGQQRMILMKSQSGLVADGKWHHICVSLLRGNIQKGTFYLDGIKCGEFDSSNVGNSDSPATLNIGGHVHRAEHAFVGHIDEVRIYGRGLTEEEVKSVMNRTD